MISTTHLHPMLVHFPIALVVFGFIAEIAAIYFKKEVCLSKAGYFLLIFGTLSAIVAWLTGNFFTAEMSGAAGEIKETHELFYYPKTGETLQTTSATIPQLESLLLINGNGIGKEIHNIQFNGLTFRYNSWMRASIYGTASNQAEWLQDGFGGYNYSTFVTYSPAAIQIDHARQIEFINNTVESIGSVGLGLNNNVNDVKIIGNVFQDISDAAITLSQGFRHAYITKPDAPVRNILISNNLIYKTSIEYWGAPAITASFVDHIEITHNNIQEINYSGISLGWGDAAFPDSTTTHDNLVIDNKIIRVSLSGINGNPEFGGDAGGIYTLGQQPGTLIEGNYIKDVIHNYSCIYTDGGSAFIEIKRNLCENAPSLFNQTMTTQHDIILDNNYSNVTIAIHGGQNIQTLSNHLINGPDWPEEAQSIIMNSGLELPYLDLINKIDY